MGGDMKIDVKQKNGITKANNTSHSFFFPMVATSLLFWDYVAQRSSQSPQHEAASSNP